MQKAAKPVFISGTQGKIFALDYRPDASTDLHHTIHFLPPFAEEMNRSRRMFTLQALQLIRLGFRVIISDLYGTGDSEGDFNQARWETWLEDIAIVCEWAKQSGSKQHSFLGARLGALLALLHSKEMEAERPEIIVMWQPCTSGSIYMRQFLRLRLAASLSGDDQPRETTKDLMSRFERGESLEVAGYELAPELALEIDAVELKSIVTAQHPPLLWLDLATGEAATLPTASNKIITHLQEIGINIRASAIEGDPFWSTQEIAIAPNLLDATTTAFASIGKQ